MTPRLVIFDADGTLRETLVPGQPCPHHDSEWRLIDGVQARVSRLPAALQLGVASNQDHVGYGLVSQARAHQLLVSAIETASQRKVEAAAVRLCPHRLEEPCRCRKPAPGMLLDILRHYGSPASHALFVGNSSVDQEAADAARMAFCWAHEFFARH